MELGSDYIRICTYDISAICWEEPDLLPINYNITPHDTLRNNLVDL